MRSMTGIGYSSFSYDIYDFEIVIKSVNSKGLDLNIRAPHFFKKIESFIRKKIKELIKRGTLNIYLNLKSNEELFLLDKERFSLLFNAVSELSSYVNANISQEKAFEIALMSFKIKEPEFNEDDIISSLDKALDEAIFVLIKSKEEEGLKIKKDILELLENIKSNLEICKDLSLSLTEKEKQKLLEKSKNLNLIEKDPVLVNELMLLLERLDVNEELKRAFFHIESFYKIINSEEIEKGKKLEFLSQELLREITTLGNKLPDLSNYIVEMKTNLDKIKQHIANVE